MLVFLAFIANAFHCFVNLVSNACNCSVITRFNEFVQKKQLCFVSCAVEEAALVNPPPLAMSLCYFRSFSAVLLHNTVGYQAGCTVLGELVSVGVTCHAGYARLHCPTRFWPNIPPF